MCQVVDSVRIGWSSIPGVEPGDVRFESHAEKTAVRVCSLIGLEHFPVTEEDAGSSPLGSA